jgi:hypothetical protein
MLPGVEAKMAKKRSANSGAGMTPVLVGQQQQQQQYKQQQEHLCEQTLQLGVV